MKAVKTKSLWWLGIFRLVLLFASNVANGQGKKEVIQLKPIYVTSPLTIPQPKTFDEIMHSHKMPGSSCICSECRAKQNIVLLECYPGMQNKSESITAGGNRHYVCTGIPNISERVAFCAVEPDKTYFRVSPRDNIYKVAAMVPGVRQDPRTGELYGAGARPENTVYMIDGIMVRPASSAYDYGRSVKW